VREVIIKEAIDYAIARVEHTEIDKINILNASIFAMHKALVKIKTQFEFIIVDGNRFKPFQNINHQCIIQGDGKYASIAAASILAKTSRDEWMVEQSQIYPLYNWSKNKGYATADHREAIVKYGKCELHRMSFLHNIYQYKLDL
jgi:ribonuclease HII